MSNISLFELNKIVKEALDTNLAPTYWVVAEISELRTTQKGHCYLELVEKDENRIIAKSRATIWSYTYRNLSTWFEGMTGKALQPGIKILCNLSVQYHEMYGLSYNIKDIDANFTIGERARKRKEIIEQLQTDGIFDMNKSLSLPLVPQNIAVISSPTAAGFGDFANQIEHNNRNYKINITLFKSTMQGDEAAESIISALHSIHNRMDDFDLICVIRGGGSQLDLDCFDNYDLASHIAQFPLPVLTGIGHERDESITDLVAHTKLKTPTAVAEFLIEGFRAFEEKLERSFAVIFQHAENVIKEQNNVLNNAGHYLKSAYKNKLSKKDNRLNIISDRLKSQTKYNLKHAGQKLERLEERLSLINPLTILERGYTMTVKNGKKITDTTLVEGDEIETITKNRKIKSTITQIKK